MAHLGENRMRHFIAHLCRHQITMNNETTLVMQKALSL